MKNTVLRTLTLIALSVSPLALAVGCSHSGNIGTSREVSHTESTSQGWFGGEKHEANTVYKNSDGSTSVETETTSVKDGKTVITRERKTTRVDGSVKTDRETRTIVKGTDNTTSESKVVN